MSESGLIPRRCRTGDMEACSRRPPFVCWHPVQAQRVSSGEVLGRERLVAELAC